jgi:hypothetical protein
MSQIRLKFAQNALGRHKGDVEEFDSDDPVVQSNQRAGLLVGEFEPYPEANDPTTGLPPAKAAAPRATRPIVPVKEGE